jgi:hypothetical protein
MKLWKIVLSFVAVFLAGAFVGGAVTLRLAHEHFFRPPRPADMVAHIIADLRSELGLTPEQVDKIKPIVEKSTAEAEEYRRQIFQRLQAIFDASDDSIKAQLTSAQIIKFDQLKAKRPKPPEMKDRK